MIISKIILWQYLVDTGGIAPVLHFALTLTKVTKSLSALLHLYFEYDSLVKKKKKQNKKKDQ